MLRKLNCIATLSLACALAASPLCADEPVATPSTVDDVQISDTNFAPDVAREQLSEAAKNQDVDALKQLLDAAKKNRDVVGLDLTRYALAYYYAKINATDKSRDALEAFAREFRVDARENDAAVGAALRVCRDLARFDSELAKKLFYEIVDDLARSDSIERQRYANALCKTTGLLRPYAASDAELKVESFAIPENLDSAGRRALEVKNTLAYYARRSLVRDRDPDFENAYLNANGELLRLSIPEVQFNGAQSDDVTKLLNVAKTSQEVQKIRESLENQNASLGDLLEPEILGRYFALKALETKGSDAPNAAPQEIAREAVAELQKTKSDAFVVLSRIAHEIYFAIEREGANPALLIEYAKALKSSDSPTLAQFADSVEGLERFRTLVGEMAILEGVCEDGTEVSLDDYRGMAVLVVLKHNDRSLKGGVWDPTQALKQFAGRFAVVEYSQSAYANLTTNTKPEWKKVSSKLTSMGKRIGDKEYVDLAVYYGLALNPSGLRDDMAFLIAPDGRVVARGAGVSFFVSEALRNIFDDNVDVYSIYR